MLKFRLSTLMIVIAIAALATPIAYSYISSRGVELVKYSPQGLARQLSEGRSVLILFHAAWNVQSANQLAAPGGDVWRVVRDKGLLPMSADCTVRGSPGETLRRQMGITTLPAFAVYSPESPLKPLVVSELTTETNLRAAMLGR